MKFPLMKQNDGERSVSLTMLIISFGLISIWLLCSMVTKIGGVEFREFSAGDALAYFSPNCALYFGRKWMKKPVRKPSPPAKKNNENSDLEEDEK